MGDNKNERQIIKLSAKNRRKVTLCNHNYSEDGVLHPDRIMQEYDMLFMQKGEWDIIEDGRCYHIGPGNLLILEPGRHHLSITKCTPKMRNVYIHFKREAGDILSGEEEKENASENSDEIGGYIEIKKLTDCSKNPEILHMYERIIESYFTLSGQMRELRCSILLEELLLKLSEINDSSVLGTDILVQEMIHRIHSTPDRFISPKELADLYHVSIRTVSGRFKKVTGESIHQYQLKLKLNMAYDELPFNPDRPLRDFAISYGFYDEFQFSKLFKRQFGISPSERK
ncbi:MAG: helix-turn-helix transcriptional regulator [Lachnospiraceae bacterium]|nr:helix-turn-helix transcriptional regulator [Lachnospiraceae bacterium]